MKNLNVIAWIILGLLLVWKIIQPVNLVMSSKDVQYVFEAQKDSAFVTGWARGYIRAKAEMSTEQNKMSVDMRDVIQLAHYALQNFKEDQKKGTGHGDSKSQ